MPLSIYQPADKLNAGKKDSFNSDAAMIGSVGHVGNFSVSIVCSLVTSLEIVDLCFTDIQSELEDSG
jgi:hypothetical protein